MLSLHREAQCYMGEKKAPKSAHAGLWYDRFFNQYDNDCKVSDDGKSNWIKTVAGSTGDIKKLDAFAVRQQALVAACGGQWLVMSTDWHFVTGLGNNHPVENGFAWHPTLGVPYLTGAAVKGMVRAWCEVWEEMDRDTIRKWFGPSTEEMRKKTANPAAGELIFFDAVPTRPVKLKADIMTPHYGKWYAEGESRPNEPDTTPSDWHDPVPVPFLVVDKGALFQFAVARRAGSDIDLGKVTEALSNTLQWLGAGAKTAVGYGRMQRNRGEEQRLESKAVEARRQREAEREKQLKNQAAEERARALGLSGLAMEMMRDAQTQGWAQSKGRFVNEAGEWLGRIESEDSEHLAMAATWLAEQMNTLFPGIMADPDKVRGKKARPVFKNAQRKLAHRLIAAIGE